MTYTGTWTTLDDAEQYLGTARTAGVGAKVTFTMTAERSTTVQIVGGPSEARVKLSGDGNTKNLDEELTTPKGGVLTDLGFNFISLSPGTHEITVEVLEGTFLFDGLAINYPYH